MTWAFGCIVYSSSFLHCVGVGSVHDPPLYLPGPKYIAAQLTNAVVWISSTTFKTFLCVVDPLRPVYRNPGGHGGMQLYGIKVNGSPIFWPLDKRE